MLDNYIVYIDLSNKNVLKKRILEDDRRQFLGGSGINTKILLESEAMYHDALSDKNLLIFGVGVGVGTRILTGNRSVITAKSPLTDIYGDSNIGGDFPINLRKLGIDHLVFKNVSETPVYLYINKEQTINILDADDIWGMNTDDVTDLLQERHGGKCEVACIGPAGEKLSRFSNVCMSKVHFAGRMGMGCIMGHKKLKAIVIDRTIGGIKVYDEDKLLLVNKRWLECSKSSVNFKMMSLQGTLLLIKQYGDTDSLPVNNSMANNDVGCENLNARVFSAKYEKSKLPCRYCTLGCGKKYEIREGRFKGEKGARLEYGSVASLGPAIGIFDYSEVIHLKLIGDRIGVDSMECGAVIALIFELQSRNLLPKKFQNNDLFKFGNVDGAEYLMRLMVSNDEFGKIISQGAYRTAQHFNALQYAFCIKKSSTGLHSNRRKAWSLGYITSTRGGDHLKNFPFTSIFGGPFSEIVAKHIFKMDFKNKYHDSAGKGRVVWWHENYKYVLDSLGVCLFGMHGLVTQGRGYFDDLADVLHALIGLDITEKELFSVGERIYQLQNIFNILSGMVLEDYKWPLRREEDSEDSEFLKDTTINERDEPGMLPEYFKFRGLTREGKPTVQRLKEIGLVNYVKFSDNIDGYETLKMEDALKEVRLSFKMKIGEKIKSKIIFKIVNSNIERSIKKAIKVRENKIKEARESKEK